MGATRSQRAIWAEGSTSSHGTAHVRQGGERGAAAPQLGAEEEGKERVR